MFTTDILWKRNYERHVVIDIPDYVTDKLESAFISLKENDLLEKSDFTQATITKDLIDYKTFHALCNEILLLIQIDERICNLSKKNQVKLSLKNLYFLDYKKNQTDYLHTFRNLGHLTFSICVNTDKSNRVYKSKQYNDTEVMLGNIKNRAYVADSNCIFKTQPIKNKLTVAVGILEFVKRDKPLSEKIFWLAHDLPKKLTIWDKVKKLWH